MAKARVMVLALDAADPGLVRRLAAAGGMPAMARLIAGAAQVQTLPRRHVRLPRKLAAQ